MDAFELYFRQADADGDGKISGGDAVGFFRGAGLPQNILAKIWQFSDQAQRGFLTKPEFFFALKLVTIAQSGKELTPDIARAVFAGSPSLQIPAPRIASPVPGSPAIPRPQFQQQWRPQSPSPIPNPSPSPSPGPRPSLEGGFGGSLFQATPRTSVTTVPTSGYYQAPAVPPPASSTVPPAAFQASSNQLPAGASQLPSFQASTVPATSSGASQLPSFQASTVPSTSSGASSIPSTSSGGSQFQPSFPGSTTAPASAGGSQLPSFQAPASQFQPSSGMSHSSPVTSGFTTGTPASTAPPSTTPTTTALSVDLFGGDAFKATTPTPSRPMLPDSFGSAEFAAFGNESALVPVAPPPPPPAAATTQPVIRPMQTAALVPAVSWPKMTPLDVQRYTQVFVQADTDRDGKIRGDQARDLFLSWQIPRDVLKQIWDLSDRDGDSMLSLEEFCIALYFMERYREGKPVPPVLPAGFLPDVLPSVGPGPVVPPGATMVAPGGPVWSSPAGPGVPPGGGPAGLMPMPPSAAEAASSKPIVQYKSKVPPLPVDIVNQLNRDDQSNLRLKHREAEEVDKKVFELDREIADAREKIDFYRQKLQEIILYKTRSDNKLLEITERLASDKREVELLRRRYDLKFQQAGETNSRLSAEDAVFNDIQKRKMEIYNAIAKIDKGSGTKEALQERAEQVSSELTDLRNLLNQRAKQIGLRAKPTSAMELPFGWQPKVQENASDWEDWEKFETEGFVYFQKTDEPVMEAPIPPKTVDSTENVKPETSEAAPSESTTESSTDKAEAHEDPEGVLQEEPLFKAEEAERAKEPPPAPQPAAASATSDAQSWSSVFSDEDFGAPGLGLKSIKTSDVRRGGDESVPETPLFKTPETPLFKPASSSSPTKAEDQPPPPPPQVERSGEESVPDTPLFKTETSTNGRDAFAMFDAFNVFDNPPGFQQQQNPRQQEDRKEPALDWSTF